MITALHALLYSEDPPTTRAFLRDVLGWPFLENPESGPGWLIFRPGPSELGVHPSSWTYEGQTTTLPIHHEISLICDDRVATSANRQTPSRPASCERVRKAAAFNARSARSERRERSKLDYVSVSAMSTETSIVDFFASVKITPLTGGTSP
jgi:hypothetical protein